MVKKAILVMTYGSPAECTFEGIAEFFTNIRRGVRPSDEEINILLNNYLKINGSPLQEITKKTVELFTKKVSDEYQVYFANKFSAPFIPDVICQMENDNIDECICLILEPHYSFYSIMGYEKFIKSEKIKFNIIKSWYDEEKLINYWATEIKKIIVNKVKGDSYKVIFSAHSVPEIAFKYSDPYIEQIFNMTDLIANTIRLEPETYVNTWQSESDIGMPWVKPDVLEYLKGQSSHPEHYIFVPLSFVSEHIEVLFDNDVECKDLCEDFDVNYHRPPMPNFDERFIDILVSVVEKNKHNEFRFSNPEKSTFDEMNPDSMEDSAPEMPEFVKELIAKKGGNVEMPEFVKQMLGRTDKSTK
ncbi:ferrochelatase [Gemella bergeri ATCC 700627]|uniref:Coproporphyrin III ferrochelatase n=1 Tax=Gemella bergeri ATCC 700627 TaxID=1321820 RepID=U2QQC6_9BACL|nr:ferrochelatase [Gemella bergeri]ERK58414.1 ferrochelatase [Gemella bergeri ATCC 700627]